MASSPVTLSVIHQRQNPLDPGGNKSCFISKGAVKDNTRIIDVKA
jgi:hypothetical protein